MLGYYIGDEGKNAPSGGMAATFGTVGPFEKDSEEVPACLRLASSPL